MLVVEQADNTRCPLTCQVWYDVLKMMMMKIGMNICQGNEYMCADSFIIMTIKSSWQYNMLVVHQDNTGPHSHDDDNKKINTNTVPSDIHLLLRFWNILMCNIDMWRGFHVNLISAETLKAHKAWRAVPGTSRKLIQYKWKHKYHYKCHYKFRDVNDDKSWSRRLEWSKDHWSVLKS